MTALLMNKNGKIKASTGEKKPVTVGSVLVYIGLIFWMTGHRWAASRTNRGMTKRYRRIIVLQIG